jgi:hypothetical protein
MAGVHGCDDRIGAKVRALEVYLQRATRGLFGARKLEVRSELEEHVLELAWADQVRGVPQETAILNALEHLGSVSSITRDMNRIYTLPLIVRVGLIATVLAALAFALLPQELPQIAAFELPTPSLKENLQILSLSGLQGTLEPLGVRVQMLESTASLRFPHSENAIQLELFDADQTGVIATSDFVQALAFHSKLEVSLEGWRNPTVRVGQTRFKLGTEDAPVTGYALWAELLGDQLFLNTRFQGYCVVRYSNQSPSANGYQKLELRVPVQPGSIIAAITAPTQIDPNYRLLELDVGVVDAQGISELFFRHAPKKFVNSVQELRPGNHNVMLVRFTGRINANGPAFEIIQPN